jgi:hypothetical protein
MSHTDSPFSHWSLILVASKEKATPGVQGASYVNLSLKVIVTCAPRSLIAFKPLYLHASSASNRIIVKEAAIYCLGRVKAAFDEFIVKHKCTPKVFANEAQVLYHDEEFDDN